MSLSSLVPAFFLIAGSSVVAVNAASLEQVRDVRLVGALGQAAGTYTTTFDRQNGADTRVVDDVSLKHRAGIIGVGSFGSIAGTGSPLLGISLTQHQIETDTARQLQVGAPRTVGNANATVFGLHVGWAIQVTGGLHVEAMVHAGYGGFTGGETITTVNVETLEVSTDEWRSSHNGWYAEVGLTGTMAYTFASSGIQLFVQGAYFKGEGENSINRKETPGSNGVNFLIDSVVVSEYEIDNAIISAGLGFRF